jgi:hypothetical protein
MVHWVGRNRWDVFCLQPLVPPPSPDVESFHMLGKGYDLIPGLVVKDTIALVSRLLCVITLG